MGANDFFLGGIGNDFWQAGYLVGDYMPLTNTNPVSLATHEELYTLTANNTLYDSLTKTNAIWWGLSPYYFRNSGARVRNVNTDGDVSIYSSVGSSYGVRFVVSLGDGATISSGDGSESNPWIVQET